jgi:O-acetyl-ADP-ribose deacetylase
LFIQLNQGKNRKMIEIIKADITTLKVDAIVNAANNSLLGGGGVDGAIHRKAGSGLLEECKKLNGCKTGEAKITKAYNLPSKFVIHTVGPVWRGGNYNEDDLLGSCYQASLKIARDFQLESIAFPNISTGVYGFPKDRAASIAFAEVSKYLNSLNIPSQILFVTFDNENYLIYKQKLNQ